MTVYDALPGKRPANGLAVALGMFDGLHTGHMAVLEMLKAEAAGRAACVFTFSTRYGRPEAKTGETLISQRMRDGILRGMGIDCVFQPEFSDFKNMPPKDFAEDVLLGRLNAKAVFCGEDFRFGKGASAGAGDLRELLAGRADVRVVPTVFAGGEAVSSTRIRAMVQNGDVKAAALLLGRAFAVDFTVEYGRRLGRELGAPTINQPLPDGFVIPRLGVYASVTHLGDARFSSVTNVGVKPTVKGRFRVVSKTYIRGFDGDLYGQEVPVDFIEFIREERKFPGLRELKEQVGKDAEKAAKIIDWGGYL